jgi:hypothetical protein
VTDQVGAGDDLIDPAVNGYVVPVGSAVALADAMHTVSTWADARWQDAARRSRELLAACSVDRSVQGFIRGCSLALEHRDARRPRRNAASSTA